MKNHIQKVVVFLLIIVAVTLFTVPEKVFADGTISFSETDAITSLNNGIWVKVAFFAAGEGVNIVVDAYAADPLIPSSKYLGTSGILVEGGLKQTQVYDEGAFIVQLVSTRKSGNKWLAQIFLESEPDFVFGVSSLKLTDTKYTEEGGSTIIEWATNIAVTSKILYCQPMLCGGPKFKEKTGSTRSHLITLDELEHSLIYNYKIVGKDENGKEYIHPSTENEWLHFSIEAPPLAKMDDPYVLKEDGTTVKVNFVTIEDTYAFVKYGITSVNENTQAAYSYQTGLHSVQINELIPLTAYKYVVVLVNRAGEHSFSPTYTLKTSPSAIIFSGISKTQADNTSANIVFETDERCTGGVKYYLQDNPSQSWEKYLDITAYRHSITITDLLPSETYVFSTSCKMSDGTEINDDKEFLIIRTEDKQETINPVEPTQDDLDFLENEKSLSTTVNQGLLTNVKGKILLQVEEKGEAWYINPSDDYRYFLGRPAIAFDIMRSFGLGVSNTDLEKIEIGTSILRGHDSDGDSLPDLFEDSIGTDPNKKDSDNDGFEDGVEVKNGYNPLGSGVLGNEPAFTSQLMGKILIQVESHGEAWYINPADNKRYYLGRPADAFEIMRGLSLGATNEDLRSIEVGEL